MFLMTRKKRLRFFVIGVAGCFLLSCGFKAHNVLMVPRMDETGVIKLYYDREGYLYPPEAHVTPHYFYLLHQRGALKNQDNPEFATIEYALRKNDSLNNAYIRQRYNVSGADSSERFFIRLQNVLRSHAIDRVNEMLKKRSTNDLVILIHGFNDPDPDAYYFSLRRNINAYLQHPPAYIEVYWDGLTALGSGTGAPFIWQRARLNSAKVGLGLRSLLDGVDKNVHLTFLTHSLGASVAAHTLFNPDVWPQQFQEKLEKNYQSNEIPTPAHSNIQLGMLAPAISGTEIFDDIQHTVPERSKLNLKRVVVGFNRYDYAVTKGGLFPKMFGNTALGADAGGEVVKTQRIIQERMPGAKCEAVDFSYALPDSVRIRLDKKSLKKYRQSEHAILFYESNPHFPIFLERLFGKTYPNTSNPRPAQ
jgi:hypothetical protein